MYKPESLGANLSAERNRKRMTQKELADAIGVSDVIVSKWESGNGNPTISNLCQVANALGVSLDQLISRK